MYPLFFVIINFPPYVNELLTPIRFLIHFLSAKAMEFFRIQVLDPLTSYHLVVICFRFSPIV